MPTALITGIRGQDGAYLARLLLDKGYIVWGAVREAQQERQDFEREPEKTVQSPALAALGITNQIRRVEINYLSDDSMERVVETSQPDEIYNLAAQSSVARSYHTPVETGEITGMGVARLLRAVHKLKPDTRLYQASSSEIFGAAKETLQNEESPFRPCNPYGVAKVYAHWMTVNYREAFGLYSCSGILFNHESPLRTEQFVTRKICSAIARIKMGLQTELRLGNLEVARDWGFAGDYVEAMYLMLQQDQAQDYVLATGETHSLREFVKLAFHYADLDYRDWVRTDPAFYRPNEIKALVGDSTRAQQKLGWKAKVSFEQLVQFLVEAELQRESGQEHLIQYFPNHNYLQSAKEDQNMRAQVDSISL